MKTKEKIMLATFNVLVEKGLSETSISDIRDESKTSSGTIFYYFDSKDELIESTIEEYQLKKYMDQLNDLKNYEGTAYQKFSFLYEDIIKRFLEDSNNNITITYKNRLLLFLNGIIKYDNLKNKFDEYVSNYINLLRDIIEMGKENNEIRLDLSTNEIENVIKNNTFGIFYSCIVQDIEDIEEYVHTNFKNVWEFIKL